MNILRSPFIRDNASQIGVTALLFFLIATFMIASPEAFLSSRMYWSFLLIIPFSALLALALTFCVASGEIDLSFPSVMAVSGLIFAQVFEATQCASLAVGAAILTGTLAGLLNGFLVVYVGVPSIIATIGTPFFWRGA